MTRDEIKKKFPVDFPVDLLPEEASEEHIVVYRICRTGKVEPASFLPTYRDELAHTKENEGEMDIGLFSLSTYEKPRDARQKLKFFRGFQPEAIAARGVTVSCCGLVQRTRARTGTKNSHVDWWLYEGAQPHEYFHKIKPEDLRKEG
ncbi:hypothetical protein D1646_06290 [Pseudoflavonifractor sp. 60]|uniref:hypothetical protein n=1 Tax=Pseudoflavonifractor sp. 60 TaxID=2304576 RepID=UPI00136C1113|nr:hypothetical protein [Pseudoflavonifractor sp. 60]NBI66427.1 hypothetical protein [Pseudoflavonifractor sp. 60]